jgi:hypothetical protein
VSLEADAQRELPFRLSGQEKIAMGEIPLLGLEGEMDAAESAEVFLGGDLKQGLAGDEGVHAKQLAELSCAGLAVSLKGGVTVVAEGRLDLAGELDVVLQGKGIHRGILLAIWIWVGDCICRQIGV